MAVYVHTIKLARLKRVSFRRRSLRRLSSLLHLWVYRHRIVRYIYFLYLLLLLLHLSLITQLFIGIYEGESSKIKVYSRILREKVVCFVFVIDLVEEKRSLENAIIIRLNITTYIPFDHGF